MKKQTILARSIESLEGIQAPETIITRHLTEVSRSVQGIQKYIGALYEIKRPALIDTAHYYKTNYTNALKDLGMSAVQPVAPSMLRVVEEAPRPQNILKEEIIIDHVLLEQLASTNDVTTSTMPIATPDITSDLVNEDIASPIDEAQARLIAIRSEINKSSIPTKEAYADLTEAA